MEDIQLIAEYWIEWQIRGLFIALLVIFVAAPFHWRSPLIRHWILVSGAVALLVFAAVAAVLPKWSLPIIPGYILLDPFAAPIQLQTPFNETTSNHMDGSSWEWIPFLLSLVFSLVLLVRHIMSWHQMKKRLANTRAAMPRLQAQFSECLVSLGLSESKVQLLIAESNEVPCTQGWLRPKVVLPNTAEDWQPEDIQIVLTHELQHVKRNDWFWQQCILAALILYPLNPFVWKLKSLSRSWAEESVDKLSLSSGIAPMTYADTLLRQLRVCRPLRSNVVVHMHQRWDIVERVNSLIAEPYSWPHMGLLTRWQLSLLMLAMALPIATVKFTEIPYSDFKQYELVWPTIEPSRERRREGRQEPGSPDASREGELCEGEGCAGSTNEAATRISIDDPAIAPQGVSFAGVTVDSSTPIVVVQKPNYLPTDLVIKAEIPVEPLPVHLERPEYPAHEIRRGREATVEVVFDVDEYGKVINPRVLDNSSPVRFERAALNAISASRYQTEDPYGRPLITRDLTQTYIFEFERDEIKSPSKPLSQNPP